MDSERVKWMKVVLLASSITSLALLGTAAYQENFMDPWRTWQADYRSALLSQADTDLARQSADAFVVENKQVYLPALGVIDRCTTCHLGVENPAMANAAPPIGLHPGPWLKYHPQDKFGCTICHQGRGRSTSKATAHGWTDDGKLVPHIDAPMLRGDGVYTSCGRCHYELDLYGGQTDLFAASDDGVPNEQSRGMLDEETIHRSLPGAEQLARGKQLTVELGCLGCHKYRGRGGTLGPDLTYVGDKQRHDFDFSHVEGEHTVEQWLFEHFRFPRQVSPTTVMPDMGLDDTQAHDLARYMLGLHRKTAPASHTPRFSASAGPSETIRGETLFSMYCSACHGADGLGSTVREGLWPKDADPWGRDWDAQGIVIERRGDMEVLVPSLNHPDTLATVSDDYLRRIIANGRPGTAMVAWADEGGLSTDEIDLLVRFIRGWEDPAPDLGTIAADRGDRRIGGALYRGNCAACHGTNGEGGIGNSLNSSTFLAVASDAFLRDTIVYGRPNTAMPAWREFNSQEISDLLAFIRGWQLNRSDATTAVRLCADEKNTEVSVAIGRVLYNANCITCHGADGAGDLAPSINTQAFLTVVSNEFLIGTLLQGRPGTGMPSWKHLSNEDVASLVRYVRTWQTKPSKTAEWHAQVVPRGDWDAGRYLFAGQCSSCHGRDAEGATGPQLNNPAFLANATDVMLREWITYGKEGTPMLGFRKGGQGISELTNRQIEDIIAYLRLLQRATEGEIARVSKSPNGRPEKGEVLFASNCVGCHGVRGEGASGPALSNPNFLRIASDGFLMATMAIGRHGTEMRPVKRGPESILELTSDEVNDLVAFLRSWEYEPPFPRGIDAPLPHRFVIPWNLAQGKMLFASNCAGCHGEQGKGSWAPELNNEGFLASATDGFLQATIVRGRKGTAMRPFGVGAQGLVDLSPSDIDDIVAYIRQWSFATPSPMTIPAQRSLDHPGGPPTAFGPENPPGPKLTALSTNPKDSPVHVTDVLLPGERTNGKHTTSARPKHTLVTASPANQGE